MSTSKFNVGDVVVVKGQHHVPLTVNQVDTSLIECVWFDTTGVSFKDTFKPSILIKLNED